MNILLIDDNADVREAITDALGASGYHNVATACDGYEGYCVWSDNDAPDIIFCDLDMPVKDGWWFLEKLRSADAKVPVYIVSGNKMTAPQMQRLVALNAGFILKGTDVFKGILAAVESAA